MVLFIVAAATCSTATEFVVDGGLAAGAPLRPAPAVFVESGEQ